VKVTAVVLALLLNWHEKYSEKYSVQEFVNIINLVFVVVDIFVGQLKSTLTCSQCGYVSNTFEPFHDLSLPMKRVSY